MVLKDPFASAASEQTVVPEPQPTEAPESSPKVSTPEKPIATAYVDVKPNLVGFEALNDSEQVRITMKSGSAYDVPWITTDFPSIAVAHERLSKVETLTQLAEIFDITARANAKFVELVAGAKPAPVAGAPAAAPQRSAPPGATQAPGGESRHCKHGEMTFRSGVSAKTGKAWKAFMCPTPQGTADQCEAEWIR